MKIAGNRLDPPIGIAGALDRYRGMPKPPSFSIKRHVRELVA
ncbi:MAG TPA: hypothetical protein VGO73_11905 [Pyrinomonadaceae bacterium]|nr:hypothetical protein [Pyrinomonadaceae bacterium]